ncbi:hypothetical protein [Brevundimonas denitrificans]|uniref:hypothetical protein n=1 Tax=Brevundimonas denitrificans TaxID=1443434 RepID=UPI00352C7A05
MAGWGLCGRGSRRPRPADAGRRAHRHRRPPQHRGLSGGRAAGRPWSEDQRLSPLEADEERLLLGLRTTEGVSVDLINRMGLGDRVQDLEQAGRLTLSDGRVAASPEGRPVLDALLRVLLT